MLIKDKVVGAVIIGGLITNGLAASDTLRVNYKLMFE